MSFGSSFGSASTSQPNLGGFGFGAAKNSSAFGTSNTITSSGFGTTAPVSAAGTGFGGFSGFGVSTPTTGVGATAPAPAAGMGFGGFSGFGSTTTSTGFSSTTSSTTGTGFGSLTGFGPAPAPVTTTGFSSSLSSTFGSGSGTKTNTGFGFGSTSTAPSSFGSLTSSASSPFGSLISGSSPFGTPGGGGATGQVSYNPTTTNSGQLFGGGVYSNNNLIGGGSGVEFSTTTGVATTQQQQDQGWTGLNKIQELQRAYIPFFDQQGKPVMESSYNNSVPLQPNPSCEFYTILYNYKTNNTSSLSSTNRPSFVNYQKWKQAEFANPDPSIFEPVVVMGTADLKRRLESQKEATKDHELVISEVSKTLVMAKQTCAKTEKHCLDMKSKQSQLRYQLLSVMRKVELLRCKGVPLDMEEKRLRERLNRVFRDIRDPALSVQRLKLLQSQSVVERGVGKHQKGGIATDDLAAVHDTLSKQQQGLMVLSDVVRKDIRDMNIMSEKIEEMKSNPALRHALERFLSSLQ